MNVLSARPFLSGLVCCAALLSAVPTVLAQETLILPTAEEQTGEPVLDAQPLPEPLSAPLTLEAPQSLEIPESEALPGATGTVTTPSIQEPADGSIQINVLDSIDIDSAGPLAFGDGGLGPTLWQAATMAEVSGLIRELPNPVASESLRGLLVRMLLSSAPAPIKLDEVEVNAGGFVADRLAALSSLNAYDAISQLLAVVPGGDREAGFLKWHAIADLRQDRVPEACSRAAIGTRDTTDVFWQQLLVVCQALAGQQSEAELGLSLMRELGQVSPAYDRLVSGLVYGQEVILDRPPSADPLLGILFDQSSATLSADATETFDSVPPDSLRSVLFAKALDEDTRVLVAEVLALRNAINGETLRDMFGSLDFDTAQVASPLTSSADLDTIRAMALLYQASLAQQIDAARAEAVAAALSRASAGEVFGAGAAAFLPVVRDIPVRTDLVWFAEDAVRVLVMAGDIDLARGWVSIMRSAALLDAEMEMSLVRLSPLLHLAGLGQRPLLADDMTAWWTSIAGQPGAQDLAATTFTLIDALEPGASSPLWSLVGGRSGVRGGLGADLALWHRLSGAALANSPGLTVLLATHLLGRTALADASPIVVQHVIRSMVQVGMQQDARAIVLEMAVARGL